MKWFTIIALGLPLLSFAQQGPYAPAAEQIGSTAIKSNSYTIIDWAISCNVTRGYQDVSDIALGLASAGNQSAGEGVADAGIVSLGDAGVATLTFNQPIHNTIGADIAIFENSFSNTFLELAHVEISSDGINFFRFPSISLTNIDTQVGQFGTLDPTNIYNLAGKYKGNYGTPFDFEELDSIVGLNIDSVSYVRLIDVTGSIDSIFGSYDSQGNIINDPWPTGFESSGFDLDAVAALGDVTGMEEGYIAELKIYPNPAVSEIHIPKQIVAAKIYDISGNLVWREQVISQSIQIGELSSGVYFIELSTQTESSTQRFVKL